MRLLTLAVAWDAIAYQQFERYTETEYDVTNRLGNWYNHYSRGNQPRVTIPLDPGQAEAISCLAEAAGIPHKEETTEIPFPEEIRRVWGRPLSREAYIMTFEEAEAAEKKTRKKYHKKKW